MSGYSRTPLSKKLGIKPESTVLALNSPKQYLHFFNEFPDKVILLDTYNGEHTVNFIHIFVTTKIELKHYVPIAKSALKKDGALWLSWPKKTSVITTELDKFAILKFGQDQGLVDTKVAAIDPDWSGHKFVYRRTDR